MSQKSKPSRKSYAGVTIAIVSVASASIASVAMTALITYAVLSIKAEKQRS